MIDYSYKYLHSYLFFIDRKKERTKRKIVEKSRADSLIAVAIKIIFLLFDFSPPEKDGKQHR